MIPKTTLLAIASAAALAGATQVEAHARLMAANPAVDAATSAPKQIVLTFSEKLQPRFSGVEIFKDGARVPLKVAFGKDRRTMVGAPARPLGPGTYRVAWRAVTADTHRMQGAYRFTVR